MNSYRDPNRLTDAQMREKYGIPSPGTATDNSSSQGNPLLKKLSYNRGRTAIAILVILLPGLISVAFYSSATKHNRVLSVSRTVPVGAIFQETDFMFSQINGLKHADGTPLALTDPDNAKTQLIGTIAPMTVQPGTILNQEQALHKDNQHQGMSRTAIIKDVASTPKGLQPEDDITLVIEDGETIEAEIIEIKADTKSSQLTIEIWVPTGTAQKITKEKARKIGVVSHTRHIPTPLPSNLPTPQK
jgi:hypothetical protein